MPGGEKYRYSPSSDLAWLVFSHRTQVAKERLVSFMAQNHPLMLRNFNKQTGGIASETSVAHNATFRDGYFAAYGVIDNRLRSANTRVTITDVDIQHHRQYMEDLHANTKTKKGRLGPLFERADIRNELLQILTVHDPVIGEVCQRFCDQFTFNHRAFYPRQTANYETNFLYGAMEVVGIFSQNATYKTVMGEA